MMRHAEENVEGRNLWARFRAASPPLERGRCPEANALAAYLEGRVRRRKRNEIEEHLAACGTCLAAVTQARALLAEPPPAAPEAAVTRAKSLVPEASSVPGALAPAFRFGYVLAWSAAAALVACAAVAGMRLGERECAGMTGGEAAALAQADFGVTRAMGSQMGGLENQFVPGGVL